MSNLHSHLTPVRVAPARSRTARPLDLCTSPPEVRNAAAVDEAQQAELVDARLIEPIVPHSLQGWRA